jgi:hypothetical protein
MASSVSGLSTAASLPRNQPGTALRTRRLKAVAAPRVAKRLLPPRLLADDNTSHRACDHHTTLSPS